MGRTLDEWEALFLGRHYGLPVRLLDWTSNPLVALYNACEQETKSDGAVWAIIREADEKTYCDVLDQKTKPFEVCGVRMVYPTYVSPRMTAQSGFFTIHEEPRKPLERVGSKLLGKDDFDFIKLIRWEVPKDTKADLIDNLGRLSVNRQTLYPDLDGLATGLWHTEVLRQRASATIEQTE